VKKRGSKKKRKRRTVSKTSSPKSSTRTISKYLGKQIAIIEEHASKGEIKAAAETAAKGLEEFPNSPEMLAVCGYVQEMAGNHADARQCHLAALKIDPDNIQALFHFVRFLIRQGRWAESIPYLDKLKELKPSNHWVYLALGTAHMHLNNLAMAKRLIEKSISLNDKDQRAWVNLGNTLRMMRDFNGAEKALKKAFFMRQDKDVLISLSSLYTDMGQYEQGIKYAEKVLSLKEDLSADTLKASAYPYMKTGLYDKAEQIYRLALAKNPSHAESAFGLASALLVQGRLKEGWPLYRARFNVMQQWLDGPWPVWNGENISGKTLYICAEQGAGDTIQFVRFVPILKKMGAKIIFSCQPPLGRLLSCLSDYAELLPQKEIDVRNVNADFQTALLELPYLLGIDEVSHIPSDCPYLSINSDIINRWKELTKKHRGSINVGLVWAGNPKHINDHNRSIKLSMLVPLCNIPGIRLFSLQIGAASSQLKDCSDLNVVDLTHEIKDFADTAGLIESLDLVVSVDTATAHLAGALGKPVIILIPFSPDWRWFLDREDSPWYPSAHLLRQPAPGDWEPVIEKLVEMVSNWGNYSDNFLQDS